MSRDALEELRRVWFSGIATSFEVSAHVIQPGVGAALRRPFPGRRVLKAVLEPVLKPVVRFARGRYEGWRHRRWRKSLAWLGFEGTEPE